MGGDTETRLRALLVEHLCVEPERITPDARLGPDLGCDSLDSVEITMLVEDAFEIEFTDDEADGAFAVEKRVSDALALVESKLAAKVAA